VRQQNNRKSRQEARRRLKSISFHGLSPAMLSGCVK
jgi:hypothetical protein